MTEFYLTTKYTTSELEACLADAEAGMSIGKAAKANGVSYSPAWQFITWSRNVAAGITEEGLIGAALEARIAELREANLSWGDIATIVCINENACRKAFERATNVQAVGTRTGKGGRFWGDEAGEVLYQDERNQLGTVNEPGTALPVAVAKVTDLSARTMPALRASIRAIAPEAKLPSSKAGLIALLAELTA